MRSSEVNRMCSFKTVKRPNVKKRGKPSAFGVFSNSSNQTRLNLDVLKKLTPYDSTGVDLVTNAARDLLLNSIQMEPSVHRLFFPEVVRDVRLEADDLRGFPIDKLTVAMVSEAISRCQDEFKFHTTIERNNLEDALEDIYSGVYWKKLGFSLYTKLYPTVVRDPATGVCIQDFIDDDGPEWAEQILNSLTEPSWTKDWVQKIVRGHVTEEEYNFEMNTLFVKLHLLDPQSVIPAYHFLIHQRALPLCNLELATRNYLGGRLDSSVLVNHVTVAILKETFPVHVSKMALTDVDIYCGVAVEEFILVESRELGVWNGRRPDNKRKSTVNDRCSVM